MSDTVDDIRQALESLADPSARELNERHGDDHAVNLSKLRAVAKQAGTGRKPAEKHELAMELWATGDSACRLAATLLMRPKSLTVGQLDTMLRESRTPKVRTWLLNYVAKKSGCTAELRQLWFSDPDEQVAAAGWALTTERLVKSGDDIEPSELDGLLHTIEETMADSPETLQWSQNECLAQIGIHFPDFRERAVGIGAQLGVLRDYPTPKNCTSPYAPVWIGEMVSRQQAAR